MRSARYKAPPGTEIAYYHTLSRIVDRRFVLGDAEKKVFLQIMRRYERLCGVRVLTYCLMDNHFHLLVAVPSKPEVLPTEEELLSLIQTCFGKLRATILRNEWRDWAAHGSDSGKALVQKAMAGWFERMWDISPFLKAVKQHFTSWYNRKNERTGTLWEGRYKSTLVEGGDALITVAAYIDLNPVRADMVLAAGVMRSASGG